MGDEHKWEKGCCCGLALGYLLFHGGCVVAAESKDIKTENSGIETVVQDSKDRGFLLRQIDNYQKNIGPNMKAEMGVNDICRYEPSCSEYAKQAIEKHGSVKGSLMTATRLAKCNPLSNGGYDPVK